MQDSDADGGIRVKQTDREKAIFSIINNGEFAERSLVILLADALGKNPWMAGAQNVFRG